MKAIALGILLGICCPLLAAAQQGHVLYEETVKIEIQLPPEMAHMRDRIPSENTAKRQLFFDGATSLMRTVVVPESEQQLEAPTGGMRFRMATGQADNETFTDHDAHVQVEKRDFLDRTFLITDTPLELAWRLTDERASFLGYMSQKAVATTEDGTLVEAWFTPEVPAPVGPARYGGLPGLILLLSENEGRRTFIATEVSLDGLGDVTIAEPTRGRKVTRDEYQALVEERMREMGAQGGRGGAIRFQMQ
jgi:GLPGLI family protein